MCWLYTHFFNEGISPGEELLVRRRIRPTATAGVEMKANNIQWDVGGGVVGDVEEVFVPTELVVSFQSHADELDFVLRVGMASNAIDHKIVDACVRFHTVAMFAFDFVQTFPVLKIVVVV